MAYSTPFDKPKCECGKPATHYVFNRFNARCGAMCFKHAEAWVTRMNLIESQESKAIS